MLLSFLFNDLSHVAFRTILSLWWRFFCIKLGQITCVFSLTWHLLICAYKCTHEEEKNVCIHPTMQCLCVVVLALVFILAYTQYMEKCNAHTRCAVLSVNASAHVTWPGHPRLCQTTPLRIYLVALTETQHKEKGNQTQPCSLRLDTVQFYNVLGHKSKYWSHHIYRLSCTFFRCVTKFRWQASAGWKKAANMNKKESYQRQLYLTEACAALSIHAGIFLTSVDQRKSWARFIWEKIHWTDFRTEQTRDISHDISCSWTGDVEPENLNWKWSFIRDLHSEVFWCNAAVFWCLFFWVHRQWE